MLIKAKKKMDMFVEFMVDYGSVFEVIVFLLFIVNTILMNKKMNDDLLTFFTFLAILIISLLIFIFQLFILIGNEYIQVFHEIMTGFRNKLNAIIKRKFRYRKKIKNKIKNINVGVNNQDEADARRIEIEQQKLEQERKKIIETNMPELVVNHALIMFGFILLVKDMYSINLSLPLLIAMLIYVLLVFSIRFLSIKNNFILMLYSLLFLSIMAILLWTAGKTIFESGEILFQGFNN
ncbi:hypothetical protein DOK76_12785 [Vagococcus sp. DIV0080]|uniref:Uncharacterized protein n=1 Tax=Candidatus Vagococcus giribetii TaxID=2230876 RepID=A0ABS3HW07_9ENTE|nr:hypothetical protein [Vagococcus sp. DIV0080]MBO0477942.1 hypothetical protein [Vagococcus sp. DIV0080]